MRASRLGSVVLKEVRQMRRDPATLAILVAIPAIMLLLFGYALTLDVEHVRLAVSDGDRTRASRDLVSRFTRAGSFDLVAEAGSAAALERLLDEGRARAGLVIPPGYERTLREAGGAKVQLLLDGSDSNTARIAQGFAAVIARDRATEVLLETLGGRARAPAIEVRPRVFFNPELRSAHFIVPGLTGIFLLIAAVMMTAMAVVRERERGTLEVLIASPIRPVELIAGKTAPYVAVASIDLALALAVGHFAFGVPFRGSAALLVAVAALFLIGALGFGLVISTIARSQQAAWQIGLVTTLLPAFILSGFIFPIENMPGAIQAVTALIPARYFLSALRAVVLKGAGAADIAFDMAALAAFAVAFPLLAAARFRKRIV